MEDLRVLLFILFFSLISRLLPQNAKKLRNKRTFEWIADFVEKWADMELEQRCGIVWGKTAH